MSNFSVSSAPSFSSEFQVSAKQEILEKGVFREALASFATGVAIVTSRANDGRLVGLTVNSFSSVSLEPPLVLWSLAKTAASMPIFLNASHYAINVLSLDQEALARQFASKNADRFAGVKFQDGVLGSPLINDCLAWFECANRSHYDEGDHVIFVGEVKNCRRVHDVSPLLFYNAQFTSLI